MSAPAHAVADPAQILRVEVRPAPGHADPIGAAFVREALALGVTLESCIATHIYLIQPTSDSPINSGALQRVLRALLVDPVTETGLIGAAAVLPNHHSVEVHPLPGVMDPVAQSVQHAIQELLNLRTAPEVATGWRYDLSGTTLNAESAHRLAAALAANPVIQRISDAPHLPKSFPSPAAHTTAMREVMITKLSNDALVKLSRDAHLFLSLEEMQAVQAHYHAQSREPREIELETLAQTWSEHCVHKTLKSTIKYMGHQALGTGHQGKTEDAINWNNRPGHDVQPDGTIVIHNLLKSTVAAATRQLIEQGVDWTLSVFVDNSGVIAFDEQTAVCIKVETHNHPSAIEPYGGAATGIGGCIRDVVATGLGARPIASTDVFCVALPSGPAAMILPEGCIPPRRILSQVVAGVRDYGNRMGIPTVNGAVWFDDRYIGNPLVYCGCIGVMPNRFVHGRVQAGDAIVALGGRTGRDGIHGATFSSAELEHTATDEFAHAVQIGNAITQKQTLDAILRARDEFAQPLYTAMTDCGAGGFSSAIGEMAKHTGALVHLDRAPLKYAGLSATEIWISEAQERFVLSVPKANLDKLATICREEGVDMAILGDFSSVSTATPPTAPSAPASNGHRNAQHPELGAELVLTYHDVEVGRLNMHFLHEGVPMPTREATWNDHSSRAQLLTADLPSHSSAPSPEEVSQALLQLLAHPNIASKHWIIRQYDHEVRGGTALKPLVGPLGRGPGDASVVMPVPTSTRGLAVASGLQTGLGDPSIGGDPYVMTVAAIDECVRNLVCVGADPSRIAILDNFCWPSCTKPENLGSLVRAAEGCYDGAMAYRTPFVSGKDSLNNQFTTKDGKTIEIPPTLLITGIGIVKDVRHACSMDAKSAGNVLLLVGTTSLAMGGAHAQRLNAALASVDPRLPRVDLVQGPRTARAVADIIARQWARSAHDVSDGGLLCAISEMLIAGSTSDRPIGAELDLSLVSSDLVAACFGESPSRYVLELQPDMLDDVRSHLRTLKIPFAQLGELDSSGTLTSRHANWAPLSVQSLAKAWLGTLDW